MNRAAGEPTASDNQGSPELNVRMVTYRDAQGECLDRLCIHDATVGLQVRPAGRVDLPWFEVAAYCKSHGDKVDEELLKVDDA